LYHFGGVYSDIGHIFLQPMTSFINFDFDECVLVKDLHDKFIQIHNAFMAAYPRHPLIKSMLVHITKNIENKYYGNSPLAITGPDALGVLFSKYYGLPNNKNINSGVYSFYNNKVKFLRLDSSIFQNHIVDINDNKIIKTKFDNFKAIVYSDDVLPHYSEIWKNKQVYGEPEPQKHECIIS
jgi:mannosyltransferase OCH1-like enzyme